MYVKANIVEQVGIYDKDGRGLFEDLKKSPDLAEALGVLYEYSITMELDGKQESYVPSVVISQLFNAFVNGHYYVGREVYDQKLKKVVNENITKKDEKISCTVTNPQKANFEIIAKDNLLKIKNCHGKDIQKSLIGCVFHEDSIQISMKDIEE